MENVGTKQIYAQLGFKVCIFRCGTANALRRQDQKKTHNNE